MSVATSTTETPEHKVARLNEELRGKSAQEIITAAVREFGRKITYVSSFDTGMHFHQTLQYRDALGDFLKLSDIRTVHPVAEEVKAVDPKGVLNKSDPDACCEVRKVRPLEPALRGFDAWITGRKRFHGGGR